MIASTSLWTVVGEENRERGDLKLNIDIAITRFALGNEYVRRKEMKAKQEKEISHVPVWYSTHDQM